MKRVTGYYATQRRHARATARESTLRRAERHARPKPAGRRFRHQTHALGGRDPRIGRIALLGAVVVAAWWFGAIHRRRR